MLIAPKTDPQSSIGYSRLAIFLHWVVFFLFAASYGIIFYAGNLPLGAQKFQLYNLHKSLGMTIFLLALLRLFWRLRHPPPPLPAHLTKWESLAAQCSHFGLYFVMFVSPVLGVLYSQASNFPVSFWGWFVLPAIIAPDQAISKWLVNFHVILGRAGLALIVIHAAAALRHHFILRDVILIRMIPWLSRRSGSSAFDS